MEHTLTGRPGEMGGVWLDPAFAQAVSPPVEFEVAKGCRQQSQQICESDERYQNLPATILSKEYSSINIVDTDEFKNWSMAYNSLHPDYPCLRDILLSKDANLRLQRFVVSMQKKSGEKYPLKSIHLYLWGSNST